MDNISNATVLTLTVTIFLAALNFFFGIHGRLKKFTNERISVYKEISSLDNSKNELSDAKIVASQKLKSQVLFELTKIKDNELASLMLELMKKNPELDTKKEASIRTVIDCLDKELISLSPFVSNTAITLNKEKFLKKRFKGIYRIVIYIALAIIFSQATFSLVEMKNQIPLALVTGSMSIFMLIQYTLCLITYPALGSFIHYKKLIDKLKK
ncbi:hypothetical protein AC790_18735 [Pantoea sp. RIT-PI-b]|uniref:hypothetical protein n=1 Tax=Pantoea sp. RIT-PI-b TaxID=1681195 RepID=UPI000675C683|nr:hypothetical protein [Pantoea sp. RIT-PI-b]KNC07585.1 hypothetical protein AC790_18735 [Pantoea sp. RIT-PI-b]